VWKDVAIRGCILRCSYVSRVLINLLYYKTAKVRVQYVLFRAVFEVVQCHIVVEMNVIPTPFIPRWLL
jgi:hypothetical protein